MFTGVCLSTGGVPAPGGAAWWRPPPRTATAAGGILVVHASACSWTSLLSLIIFLNRTKRFDFDFTFGKIST